MPLRVKCRYVVLHDCSVAATALGREHVEVVVPTVGLSITFMEAILAKLLSTLSTEEVLRVPGLFQSRYAFLKEEKINKIIEILNYFLLSINWRIKIR